MQQLIKLSKTSKLNCFSFGLDAHNCITGGKLRKVKNSVCSKCYALRGNYNYKSVIKGKKTNLEHLQADYFVYVMTYQLQNLRLFRWFDSGDLPSLEALKKIVEIANNTPHCKQWLATREIGIVQQYLKQFGEFPKNLIVRVSSPLIDDKPLKAFQFTSTVHKDKKPIGFICKAIDQGNQCLDCVACWDRRKKNISYKQH